MRISLEWLKTYIDIDDLSPAKIAETLTDLGLEVEAMETMAALPDQLVIGRILDAERHPNADKLQVCKVDIGDGQTLQIVCGARNARKELLVVAALPGAALPNGMKIATGAIRGIESAGMLCSDEEIGLDDKSDGIIELKQGKPGQKIAELLGGEDQILVLNLTPNRADCLSYIGVARELSAKLNRPLRTPEVVVNPQKTNHGTDVQIEIVDSSFCERFVALSIKNVGLSSSPLWLKRRLRVAGMRPINLLVDISNYVMLETGHPNHAYDAGKIKGNQIRIKGAGIQDRLVTLDGASPELKLGDILICDGEAAIGLAGVMGGQNSEISASTKDLVLEVAAFNPINIRKTSKRLAFHTEASHRFERGVSSEDCESVAWRYAQVLQNVYTQDFGMAPDDADFLQIANSAVDKKSLEVNARRIALRLKRMREVIGRIDISAARTQEILKGLGCTILEENGDRLVCEIPHWRLDLQREIDLIEEVARVDGFDKIPYTMPRISMQTNYQDPYIDFCQQLKKSCAHAGLSETITFPFMSASDAGKLGIEKSHALFPAVTLRNPINEHEPFLKTMMAISLLKDVLKNRNAGVQGCRFFEYGRVYFAAEKSIKSPSSLNHMYQYPSRHLTAQAAEEKSRPVERKRLAGVLDQPFQTKAWSTTGQQADFYHLKSILESVLNSMGLQNCSYSLLDDEQAEHLPFLHPKESVVICYGEQVLGYAGRVHPRIALNFDLGLKSIPLMFELDAELIFSSICASKLSIDNRSFRFPGSYRDLAFIADEATTHAAVQNTLRQGKAQFLDRWEIFDVYRDERLPSGKKSMAYRFHFRSADKTLSDKEVDKDMKEISASLEKNLGIQLRG